MTAAANTGFFSDHELREVRGLIEQRSGILFEGARERFFSARLSEYADANQLKSGSDVLRRLHRSNTEYDSLLERLLTQETSFFRYPDVFHALEKHVVPDLRARKLWQDPHSLRIWSAGCATGEEPYSIAMALADTLEFAEAWNIQILATDISRAALRVAEAGVFRRRQLHTLSPRQVETYLSRSGDQYTLKPKLRAMVTFAPMNLAQPTYLGRFDCIFCMNVLIYFSAERRAELVRRFYQYLEPGGYLFLGHAETTNGAAVKFKTIVHRDARFYQKPAATQTAAEKERP